MFRAQEKDRGVALNREQDQKDNSGESKGKLDDTKWKSKVESSAGWG